ncbi:MAG: hypothetical protein R3F65_27035 [bacterium]
MITLALTLLLAAPPLAQPIDANTWALHRPTVLALFADPTAIQRQTWIVLHYRTTTGGPLEARDVIGLELRGIDRGSDLDRAGFRTGDIVTWLDGARVADFGTALGVGWRIRARAAQGETDVPLTLLRAGRTHQRTYRIVDTLPAARPPPPAPPRRPRRRSPPRPRPETPKTPRRPAQPPAPAPAPTPAPAPESPPAPAPTPAPAPESPPAPTPTPAPAPAPDRRSPR